MKNYYLIEVRKKQGESFERMVRRFNRSVQQSGTLSLAKEQRFFEKEPNRRAKRESAARRSFVKSQRRKKILGF